jgi:hypothetical protein
MKTIFIAAMNVILRATAIEAVLKNSNDKS